MATEGWCVGSSPASGSSHSAWKGSIFTPEKWPEVFEGWKRVHSSSRAKIFRTVAGAWCTSHGMHEAGHEERRCFFGCSGDRSRMGHEPWANRFGGLTQPTQKAREFRSHATTHKTYTCMCACTRCMYVLYVCTLCLHSICVL